jgi:hypothetical protein
LRTVGLLCGGFPEDELREAGCVAIFRDPAAARTNVGEKGEHAARDVTDHCLIARRRRQGPARGEPSPHGCPSIVPARARKAELPPGLVDDHGDRVREVEAPAFCGHRDAEYVLGSKPGEEIFGQATGLGAEQQGVSELVSHGRVAARPSGRECEEPCRPDPAHEGLQGVMARDPGPFPIVEPGSPELGVAEGEPERRDEVQGGAGIGAKPDNIAGIGRDLGLE